MTDYNALGTHYSIKDFLFQSNFEHLSPPTRPPWRWCVRHGLERVEDMGHFPWVIKKTLNESRPHHTLRSPNSSLYLTQNVLCFFFPEPISAFAGENFKGKKKIFFLHAFTFPLCNMNFRWREYTSTFNQSPKRKPVPRLPTTRWHQQRLQMAGKGDWDPHCCLIKV